MPSTPRRPEGNRPRLIRLAVLVLAAWTGGVATAQVPFPAPPAEQPGAPVVPLPPAWVPPVQAPPAVGVPVPPMIPMAPGAPPGGAPSPVGAPVPPGATPGASQPAAPSGPSFQAVWNNGLFFQTKDKDFVAHVGATLQYDGAWFSASPSLQVFPGGTGPFDDGVNVRRGRFFFEGSMYKNVDYKFELEFFNGMAFVQTGQSAAAAPQFSNVTNAPGPTDAWVTLKNVPVLGHVRIGSQKEWFSLEHLNVYRYLEFMERSLLFDFSQATAFNNGFTPGVSAFNTWLGDRVFTAIGAYKNSSDLLGFGVGDGQYAVTGRLAATPIYLPDEECFWHVGGAMSHRDPVDGQVQVRVRDSIRNAPFPLLPLLINTGLINASSQDLFNIETAAVSGPWTFQSEYTANVIRGASVGTGPNVGNLLFQGFYAEMMVFLTGESRQWDNQNFFFKRVIPRRNFLTTGGPGSWCAEGLGAWELAARYTYLDVDDKVVRGGRLNDVTLGLNWYWNPNVKMQFNYDYTYRDMAANPLAKGQIHAFGTRLSVDF